MQRIRAKAGFGFACVAKVQWKTVKFHTGVSKENLTSYPLFLYFWIYRIYSCIPLLKFNG